MESVFREPTLDSWKYISELGRKVDLREIDLGRRIGEWGKVMEDEGPDGS